jgi:dTDP-glucose 4,6-dehydratase
MRVLVTGGAGFIGSNFLSYMIKKYSNYRFINLDNLTYSGNLDSLRSMENYPNYKFVKGNITDSTLVEQIFEDGVDVVVHMAAESHVDRSILDPEVFVKSNVFGTQVLLDLSKKYTIKKFLHISTDEVYGTLGDEGLFSESTPLAPNSPYSASKAASDLFVRAYHETYGLPVNITRCSNNYGPYQFPEKLIPLMISNALRGKELPVYGDGLNIRDWLYVEDHCSAIDLVFHKGKIGEVYNVGGNNERTNLQIVKTILSELNKSESLIRFVEDRPGHDRRYGIDATKIREQLGWEPQNSYEIGIKKTINWYLNNQIWLENIISGKYKEYENKQ